MLKYEENYRMYVWDHPDTRPALKAGFCFDNRIGRYTTADPARAFLLEPKSETVRRTLEPLELRYALASFPASFNKYPVPQGLEFYPFQKAAMDYALSSEEGCLIAADMGVGKTPMSCGIINATQPERVIVICPATLRINWKRELVKWTLIDEDLIQIVDKRKCLIKNKTRIIVINYELLTYHGDLLTAYVWDTLFIDESHRVSNPDAQCSAVAASITAERKYLLTGTPLLNRPKELWNQLNILQPGAWGDFHSFGLRYCNAFLKTVKDWSTGGMRKAWDYNGSSNLEELATFLRLKCMYRITKETALPQLPPKIVELIPVNATTKILKAEKEYSNVAYGLSEYEFEDLSDCMFGDMAELRHETGLLKVDIITKHVKDLLMENPERKVIIFAHHHDVVDKYFANFAKVGMKYDGRMTPTAKQTSVDRFQTDPNVRVLVASIHAAGVGLTLTAADVAVCAELDFTPGIMSQCADRLHRIGQTKKVVIQHIVFEDTIDAFLTKMLIYKKKIFNKVVNAA